MLQENTATVQKRAYNYKKGRKKEAVCDVVSA